MSSPVRKAVARLHYARMWLATVNANGGPRAPALAECKAARANLARIVYREHLAMLRRERDTYKARAQRPK